ncbi:MAG: PAS domain S-box protein, partial [Candidatus Marinimicrobia bacterium]|nr:PAS domain S-box protein [Candidatus Neomarinimicrobiota bacterium]
YLQSFNFVQNKSHIRMYVIDITESKNREKALLESEEKFRNVVESLGEGLLITDFDDEIQFVNSAMCKITGYTEDELLGAQGFELLLDQDKWKTLKDRHERRKKGNDEVYEIPLKKKDGSYFWALVHASPFTDIHGDVIGTLGAITDISDRKSAENALRESRKSLEQLVENMQEGIYRISLDGEIIFVNEALAKMHGVESAEDLIGQNVKEFTDESNYPREEFMRDLMKYGVVRNYQATWRNYQDEKRYTIENAILVRDDDDDVKHYEGTVMDVTEQKNLQEQLLQAQKMEAIGRLAGGVAHDFNNILTIILGYSRLMLGSFDTSNEYYDKIRQIEEAGERAESLVRQLLSFSRKQSASPKVLNVNKLVQNMEKMLRRLLPENKILVTGLSESIGNVKADPAHIEQVIMNLVVNARDAIKSDGHITLESIGVDIGGAEEASFTEIEPGEYVRISVSDDGIGMSPDVVQHIFEPFFTTKKEGEGTGLGLSTVYGIIKQNNGYIHVYSEPGNGTTFHVYLPVTQSREKANGRQSVEQKKDYRGIETILLAEDDKSVLDFLSNTLTDSGYSVITAENGLEAFHLFGENPTDFDLVITDVVMPKIDGPEFIKRARDISPELKSIFISGHTRTMITNSGVDKDQPFLQKPFPISELMKVVRETIDSD